MTASPPHPRRCTITCPAIRDDKGSFWCRIKRECVAPQEHRVDYGFEIISGGKIKRSGYDTQCDAIGLFASHNSSPVAEPVPETCDLCELDAQCNDKGDQTERFCPKHDEQIRQQAAAKERRKVLDEICRINTEDNICKKGKECKSCLVESLRGEQQPGEYAQGCRR